MCVVLLGIWFGAERLLVRPIRALAQTAVRIGHGDSSAHVADLPLAPEFGPLAAAMNDMAGQLAEREQELLDSNKQLLELAHVDALTGLANRRSFNARLAKEWELACTARQPVAVLKIDVDHFKMFNDYYGHVQGDACLRKVGSVLKAGTRIAIEQWLGEIGVAPRQEPQLGPRRDTDFAARYGGEEFAVLLRGADARTAVMVAERLRKGVEDLLIANRGAPHGFVSISVGVAARVPDPGQNPQTLTESADIALYQAKQRGRNAVALHAERAEMALSRAS
jgi:PleD family two-component response regulator